MTFVWDIDPEIFNLFGVLSVRFYSLLFALGLVLGYSVVRRIWIREKLAINLLETLALYIFTATLLGARIGHCLFYEPAYYLKYPWEIILPFTLHNGSFEFTGYQGLASHGGILAVFIAIIIFSRRYKLNVYDLLDKVSVGGALTAVFIRLGNFMNSEIIGIPTHSNFGVVFKRADDVVRHPAQLYEALAYLIIFLIVFSLYKAEKKRKPGFIFGSFFSLLFISRFIIEFVKIDQVQFEQGMTINMGQILSIPFIILGIIVMIIMWKERIDFSGNK